MTRLIKESNCIGFLVAEHLKPVDVKIAQLGEALESVSAEIRYLQTRDLRHRRSKYSISFHHGIDLSEQK
jgi:hypothetical protein